MITIVLLLIGLAVFAAGIYYRIKEKHDKESRKIYSIVTAAGAVLVIGAIIKIMVAGI